MFPQDPIRNAPVEVLPRLQEALGQPGNWSAKLPDGSGSLAQLRANAGAATDILLHPLGTLTVKQGVVPLNLDISCFGSAAPAGARRFTITAVNCVDSECPAQRLLCSSPVHRVNRRSEALAAVV